MRIAALIVVVICLWSTPPAGAIICQDAPACTVRDALDGDLAVDTCETVTNPAFPLVGGQTRLARPACPVIEALPWPGEIPDPLEDPPLAQAPFCAKAPFSVPIADLQCEDLFTLEVEYQWYGESTVCSSASDCILARESVGRLSSSVPGTWTLEVDAYLYYRTVWGSSPKVSGSDVRHVCTFDGPGECERSEVVEGVPTNMFVASVRGVSTFRAYWTPADGVPIFVSEHTNCQVVWGLGNACG